MTKEQPVERDNKGRYPECPLAWCHCFEHCGTVKKCIHQYEVEAHAARGEPYATTGLQYRDDR